MLSTAERPRRSPLWKLSIRFWSFVNECTVSTMPLDDAVRLVDRRQHRGDGVRGAGGRGEDAVGGGDRLVVDAVHDVLERALSRCGEQHARDARRAQVLGEAFLVAPASGVVDDDRVVDSVGRCSRWMPVVGVDHLDAGAVRDDLLGLLVDGDGAGEAAVHRIAQQQRGALGEVVLRPAADRRWRAAAVRCRAGVGDEDAGEEATDAPKP